MALPNRQEGPRTLADLPYSETDSLLNPPEEEEEGVREGDQAVGHKTLGGFYSFVFIINQIYGPGVLAIPIVFQQGGWLLTTIVLAAFCIISSFSSTLLCEALSLIPGNKQFEHHIEYTGAVRHFFGKKWYMISQVLLNLCLQAYNIASIIICSESLDQFLCFLFGKTYALELYPHFQFHSVDWTVLYGTHGTFGISIPLGYLIITALCLPSGFLNLADNVKIVQLLSFILLSILLGEFCGQFVYDGLDFNRVHMIRTDYAQLISVFIFSWAFVMFIPSWVNEKQQHVSVNKVVWASTLCSFVGYMFIGLLAAYASPILHDDDILSSMGKKGNPLVTIIASYIFSLGVIAPGIPVCLITTRYNLYVGHVCSKKWSYFWGVIAPWLFAFVFLQGQLFADLINWSSLLLNGVINFVVPPIIYYKAIRTVRREAHAYEYHHVESHRSVNTDKEDANYVSEVLHGSSTVNPWPNFLKPYIILCTFGLVGVTIGLLVFGVGIDLYYLIVKHKNLLS